ANKIAFQVKDVLFFRVLVLDRCTLKPPDRPMPMHIDLMDAGNKTVRSLDLTTSDGGILAGEIAIDDKFQPGAYTLQARPIDPARDGIQAASYRLEVVRELPLQNLIRLNKDQYAPGDKVIGEVFAPAAPAKQGKIDGQPVQIHSEPRFGGPVPPPSVPNGGGP